MNSWFLLHIYLGDTKEYGQSVSVWSNPVCCSNAIFGLVVNWHLLHKLPNSEVLEYRQRRRIAFVWLLSFCKCPSKSEGFALWQWMTCSPPSPRCVSNPPGCLTIPLSTVVCVCFFDSPGNLLYPRCSSGDFLIRSSKILWYHCSVSWICGVEKSFWDLITHLRCFEKLS